MSQTEVPVTKEEHVEVDNKAEEVLAPAPVETEITLEEKKEGDEKGPSPVGDEVAGDKADQQSVMVEMKRDSVDDDRENIPESVMTQSTHAESSVVGKVSSTRGFKVRPDLSEKFRPGVVQLLIENTIKELLQDQLYSIEEAPEWTKIITNEIHKKVKALEYKRYKLVTFVVLGEYRGGGISVSNRCLWDADSDCKATYKFLSDSLFCVGTVYGFYYY